MRDAPYHDIRGNVDFSLPCVPPRLSARDEYPSRAVGAGVGGRVVAVAFHVLILVVMAAYRRPAWRPTRTIRLASRISRKMDCKPLIRS